MSDYQDCVLREIVGPREFVVEATLCHADALLPLPDDHPTMLRMLLEGRERKNFPALRPDIGTYDDDAIIAHADEVIESVEVVWCGASKSMTDDGPNGAMARYRVRLRQDLDWKKIKAGGGWGAAADIVTPRPKQRYTDWNYLERSSKSPKRLPPAESVARLGEILASRPEDMDRLGRVLSSHEELAAPLAPRLAQALYLWPHYDDIARALGRIGAPTSIGPLVLALWQGKSHRLRFQDNLLEDAALLALGWYGPRARALAGSYLGRDQPATVALNFARWRVLGDAQARRAFMPAHWDKPSAELGWRREFTFKRAVFEGPLRLSLELIDAVRPELGKAKMRHVPFATLERLQRAKVARLDAASVAPGPKKSAATAPKKATAARTKPVSAAPKKSAVVAAKTRTTAAAETGTTAAAKTRTTAAAKTKKVPTTSARIATKATAKRPGAR